MIASINDHKNSTMEVLYTADKNFSNMSKYKIASKKFMSPSIYY